MVFLTKMDDYQKLCDTNKNVTKMGVIIKGVYCKNISLLGDNRGRPYYQGITPFELKRVYWVLAWGSQHPTHDALIARPYHVFHDPAEDPHLSISVNKDSKCRRTTPKSWGGLGASYLGNALA
jgi:hypothetical protein